MAGLDSVSRMVFDAFLPSLVRQGLSANSIIEWAKGQGLSFRRQTMLGDIRSVLGVYKLESRVKAIPPDQKPPRYAMVETELPRASAYYVRATATYIDESTGQSWQKPISFYTDESKSLIEWEREFSTAIDENPSQPGQSLSKLTYRSIEHNTGWEY